MKHLLPPLPYEIDALEPFLSTETLECHYNKHHKGYIQKLNELVAGTRHEGMTLQELVVHAPEGPVYNNAAQAWNHEFYWHSLNPDGSDTPDAAIGKAIRQSFGTVDEFRQAFEKVCLAMFGSGWVWLVKNADGGIGIRALGNAGNPLRDGQHPLLACDLWEHAYYIDYRNQRAKYLQAFWELVNWEFVAENWSRQTPFTQEARQGMRPVRTLPPRNGLHPGIVHR
jgi:Fe-Mn family superoxide dismutase